MAVNTVEGFFFFFFWRGLIQIIGRFAAIMTASV
jgi:hypothetical protein